MTGEEKYGYEAIYCAKNAMLTIDVTHNVGDWCRTYGHLMYIVSCVYDWCYPLLTDVDKRQFVGAATAKCLPRTEFPKYPPDRTGGLSGHQSGSPFLDGWYPFSLAIYDEYPEYYNDSVCNAGSFKSSDETLQFVEKVTKRWKRYQRLQAAYEDSLKAALKSNDSIFNRQTP